MAWRRTQRQPAILGEWSMDYQVGDVGRTRKEHPCGSVEWEIMRTGADFRIKCLGCGRVVMLPRPKFVKAVKTIVKGGAEK